MGIFESRRMGLGGEGAMSKTLGSTLDPEISLSGLGSFNGSLPSVDLMASPLYGSPHPVGFHPFTLRL
jgi:hypothetical protein